MGIIDRRGDTSYIRLSIEKEKPVGAEQEEDKTVRDDNLGF